MKIACWGLLCLVLSNTTLQAQDKSAAEYQVKAVFLYNFTQFIEWPQSAFNNSVDPFVIGIIGDDPFGSDLDEVVAGEKIGSHPIVIRRFQDVKDISNCQMIYINSIDQDYVEKVLIFVSQMNILTVSDAPNFIKWGGMVRFFTENNKIRLQINVEQSRSAQLTISSKLLSVAKTN